MNNDDDDNLDNDDDVECNDDQFMKFMKVDEMYDVLIEDLELDVREDVTNVHNVGVECRMGHHNLVDMEQKGEIFMFLIYFNGFCKPP